MLTGQQLALGQQFTTKTHIIDGTSCKLHNRGFPHVLCMPTASKTPCSWSAEQGDIIVRMQAEGPLTRILYGMLTAPFPLQKTYLSLYTVSTCSFSCHGYQILVIATPRWLGWLWCVWRETAHFYSTFCHCLSGIPRRKTYYLWKDSEWDGRSKRWALTKEETEEKKKLN